MARSCGMFPVFFFNDTATTEIYTLSLHDALPIYLAAVLSISIGLLNLFPVPLLDGGHLLRYGKQDRKSTRLNSSHQIISYAVFCLKKKNNALRMVIRSA